MLREFISVDRAVATTGTPYAYAGNNPTNFNDPLGLGSPMRWSQAEEEAVAAGDTRSPLYRSAMKKAQYNAKHGWNAEGTEKTGPSRNKQKRQSNFDWNPLPAIGHGIAWLGVQIWHGMKWFGAHAWDALIAAGAAIGTALAWLAGNGAAYAATEYLSSQCGG